MHCNSLSMEWYLLSDPKTLRHCLFWYSLFYSIYRMLLRHVLDLFFYLPYFHLCKFISLFDSLTIFKDILSDLSILSLYLTLGLYCLLFTQFTFYCKDLIFHSYKCIYSFFSIRMTWFSENIIFSFWDSAVFIFKNLFANTFWTFYLTKAISQLPRDKNLWFNYVW